MKQRHQLTRLRIDARKIGSLVQIAPIAGQREVRGMVAAAMLSGDNVFYVEEREWQCCLRELAVFTPVPGPATD